MKLGRLSVSCCPPVAWGIRRLTMGGWGACMGWLVIVWRTRAGAIRVREMWQMVDDIFDGEGLEKLVKEKVKR